MIVLRPEEPLDGPAIEIILDLAFEPERRTRPSYRLRDGVPPLAALCFVAVQGRDIIGTIRFWPISIGRPDNDVLLGPIAVHPAHEGQGIGSRLIRHGLDAAQRAGTGIAVAVGAPGYLGRFGFLPAARHGISLAGLDDAARFLALELEPDALASASGPVECARPGDAR